MLRLLKVLFVLTHVSNMAVAESCEKITTCSCECPQGIIDLKDLGLKSGPR